MRLDAITRRRAHHPQPLSTLPYGRASARRHTPGGQWNGIIGPPRGGVRCDGSRSRRACRSRGKTQEGHGGPPLDMRERETQSSPLAKLVPEQRSAAAEDERAVRWQCHCRETKLHARENAATPDRRENVSRTADSRVVARAVPHAPSAFDRELGGEVMANRESFAAPAQSQHGRRVTAASNGPSRIGPVRAR